MSTTIVIVERSGNAAVVKCGSCNGSGESRHHRYCAACNGTGAVPAHGEFSIRKAKIRS